MRKKIILGLLLFVALSLFLSKPQPASAATCYRSCPNYNGGINGYICSELPGCFYYSGCGADGFCFYSLTCVQSYTCSTTGGGGGGGGGGGTTTTTTTCYGCSYYGRSCGTWTNNCGQQINCGSCSAPTSCSYTDPTAGTCVCDSSQYASVCASYGRECGTWTQNGCSMNCGSCTAPATCSYSGSTAGKCQQTCGGYCSSDPNWEGCWVNNWTSTSACSDTYNATHNCPDSRCTTSTPTTTTSTSPPSTTSPPTTSGGYNCYYCSGSVCTGGNYSICPPSGGCNSGNLGSACGGGGGGGGGGGPTYRISGRVFIDNNKDGIRDQEGDTNWPIDPVTKKGATIDLSGSQTKTTTTGSAGSYSFLSLPSGSYSVTLTVPSGYFLTTPNPRSVNINSSGVSNVDFGLSDTPLTYIVSGRVYIDENENGSRDPGESGYNNATVQVGGVNTTTNAGGNYSRSGITAGSYNVTLTLPNGYSMSSGDPTNPKNVVVGPNATANFGIVTSPSYTTTGYIFVDSNADGIKNPRTCISNCGSRGQEVYSSTEDCYSGSLSVKFTPDGGESDTIQSFTSSNADPGSCNTYSVTRNEECGTISVTGLTNGYKVVMLNYKDNTHASSTISSLNSIHVCGSEVNFGVSNASPWIQTKDADIRVDSGFDDPIPTDASCGTSIGSYASMVGSGGTPGIVFSGDSSYSFGQGQASINPYNWVVGGTIYPEVFNTSVSRKTSTEYLLSKAAQLGITPIDIASSCGAGGIANCNLSGALLEGIYVANGDLVLNGASYTFPANKNYIIIVKGNLTINEKVLVPNGSTAIFSAYNINVGQTVGESDSTSTASDIEGWYSADLDFTINGINNCGVSDDLRFNIGGNIVVGASGGNGSFQNNRDLCSANTSCPSLYIKARPDFILNAPSIIKTSSYTWQEVAP